MGQRGATVCSTAGVAEGQRRVVGLVVPSSGAGRWGRLQWARTMLRVLCGQDVKGTCVRWALRFRSRLPPAGDGGSPEVHWGTVRLLGAGDPAGNGSEGRVRLLFPTAQGEAGPVPFITEGCQCHQQVGTGAGWRCPPNPSSEPHCLGEARSDRTLPMSCGEHSVALPSQDCLS